MSSQEKKLKVNGPETFHQLKEIADEWELKIPLPAPFTPNDINMLTPLLRLPLPGKAIQETTGNQTGKGYNTTGYSYQAHVDRMNWIFGPTNWKWWIHNEELNEEGRTSKGRVKYECSGEMFLEIGYKQFNDETKEWEWVLVHELPAMPTDHESMEKGSARKGMLTKGIKRATSILGVGADAYLGSIDADNFTGVEVGEEMAGPSAEDLKPFGERKIDTYDLELLNKLADRKGLTSKQIKEIYKIESQGEITCGITELTKDQMTRVKKFLIELPDKAQETPQETEEQNQGERHQLPPQNNQEEEYEAEGGTVDIEQDAQEQTQSDKPKTVAELMTMPNEIIKEIANEYSFKIPAELNDRNKGPLCKTLGMLMGLK